MFIFISFSRAEPYGSPRNPNFIVPLSEKTGAYIQTYELKHSYSEDRQILKTLVVVKLRLRNVDVRILISSSANSG